MPTFPDDTPLYAVRQILNATGIRQNNFNAGRPPINTDDLSLGYEIGSRWIYDDVEFICLSNASGSAIWSSIGAGTSHYAKESGTGNTGWVAK